MSTVDNRFVTYALVKEKHKRNKLKQDIRAAILENFRLEKDAIVGRGRVYDVLGAQLEKPVSNYFQRLVRATLAEMGVIATVRHHYFLYKNIWIEGSYELREKIRGFHRANTARRKAKLKGLCQTP